MDHRLNGYFRGSILLCVIDYGGKMRPIFQRTDEFRWASERDDEIVECIVRVME